jgi:ribosomal protein L11 methyltransferase
VTDAASDAATRTVVVSVDVADVELASDALRMAGARAIEERQVADGIDLVCVLGQDVAVLEAVARDLADRWPVRIDVVDGAVADTWRNFVEPIEVDDRLVIVPEWRAFTPSAAMVITIDPGAAFGMGDHPTTRLSAQAVLDAVGDGDTVLDMGCGSGVLGIVAARLGAALVYAVDIDAEAVTATLHNAGRNGVSDRILASQSASVPQLREPVDIICANILAPVLLDLSAALVAQVRNGGTVILSGLLVDQSRHVVDRYRSLGLESVERLMLEGWCAEVMTRR